jgi:hypothetical protein
MKINAHYYNHILYLIIEMKTLNVPQFYNGFCCYFKYVCSSFDKVIKFTLSNLRPFGNQHDYDQLEKKGILDIDG